LNGSPPLALVASRSSRVHDRLGLKTTSASVMTPSTRLAKVMAKTPGGSSSQVVPNWACI
jgi:hypothetical protein